MLFMRYSSLLLTISLFTLLFMANACQSEPQAQKVDITNQEKAKPVAISNSDQNEEVITDASEEQIAEAEEKTEKSELLEFFVEEDKEASEAKKKSDKKAEKANSTTSASTKKKSSSKGGAKMKFVNEVFQFGIIKPGDVIEHKFEFTNTGTSDLVITDAKASCGCTQPSFPFIPIKPGEKGFIGVKYDSKGKLGQQKPMVTLTTNGSPKTRKIYLEGLVISEMAKN